MERLTERTAVGILAKEDYGEKALSTLYSCYGGKPNLHYTNCEEGYCAIEKLAAYEDAEEQGLLLRLPCKEAYAQSGDCVYLVYDDEVIECTHCGLSINPVDGKAYIALAADENIFPYRRPDPEHDLDPTDWCTNITDAEVNEIGKTVFFTRKEAEAKLKGVGGKESKDVSAWKNHIMNRFMREE